MIVKQFLIYILLCLSISLNAQVFNAYGNIQSRTVNGANDYTVVISNFNGGVRDYPNPNWESADLDTTMVLWASCIRFKISQVVSTSPITLRVYETSSTGLLTGLDAIGTRVAIAKEKKSLTGVPVAVSIPVADGNAGIQAGISPSDYACILGYYTQEPSNSTNEVYTLSKERGLIGFYSDEEVIDTVGEYVANTSHKVFEDVSISTITPPVGFLSPLLNFTVYATEGGATVDIADERIFRETYMYRPNTIIIRYVDFSAPSGGNGLTLATAYSDISNAIADNATHIYIWCDQGNTCIGAKLTGYSYSIRSFANSANLIGIGGGTIIMGAIEEVKTFTQNGTYPNVWQTTRPTNGYSWVIDMNAPAKEKGLYPYCSKKTSLVDVASTPSSYYDDGSNIYIHLTGGVQPRVGSTKAGNIPNCALVVNDAQNIVSVDTAYFENITFYSKLNVSSDNESARIYMNNCGLYYSRKDNDLFDVNGVDAIINHCNFAYSDKDIANYHSQSTNISHAIEINCTMKYSGYEAGAGQSNQCSTIHDGGSIIRIGDGIKGVYQYAGQQNIHDINPGTLSWNIGINAIDNGIFNVVGTTPFSNFTASDGAIMWIEKCRYGGKSLYGINNNGATIKVNETVLRKINGTINIF